MINEVTILMTPWYSAMATLIVGNIMTFLVSSFAASAMYGINSLVVIQFGGVRMLST
jgi:hypothetical protein